MTTNMEELEKKMGIKIEGMKAMMLDWFSGVDQKLTAIEERLKKILDTQNQIGHSLERRNWHVTEKNTGEGGFDLSENRDKGKAMEIRRGDGCSSHEYVPKRPLRAQISQDDDDQYTNDHILGSRGWVHFGNQGRQGLPWEAGSTHGWVGLYTRHYGKGDSQGTDVGRVKDFCGPAWMHQFESDFGQKNRPPHGGFHEGSTVKGKSVNNFIEGRPRTEGGSRLEGFGKQVVETDESGLSGKKSENDAEKGWNSFGKKAIKMGQDEIPKDSLKSDSSGQVADAGGEEEEEEQMRSMTACGNTKDDKTEASLQNSLKPDLPAKNNSSFGFKAMQNEINGESSSMVANEGSNEKGHEEGQKPGSWGWKEEGLGSKRKEPDSRVEGRNDGLISSEPFTATRQRLKVFTSDEQEILKEIEPIMHSISIIMHQDGYNDGDPLCADDQAYILDNVFNYHPDKAQKSGAGLDYIMVSKHMNFGGSRCFYIVSTDGRKEDFSYHKCLKNFVRGKYPDKADKFIPKYFKNSEPRNPRSWDRGSCPNKAGTPPWSKWDRKTRAMVDEARKRSPAYQIKARHRSSFGTR